MIFRFKTKLKWTLSKVVKESILPWQQGAGLPELSSFNFDNSDWNKHQDNNVLWKNNYLPTPEYLWTWTWKLIQKLHLTSFILSNKEGKTLKMKKKKLKLIVFEVMMLVQVHGSACPVSGCLSKYQRLPSVQNNLLFNSVKIPTRSILIRLMHPSGAGAFIHPSKVSSQLHFNTAIFSFYSSFTTKYLHSHLIYQCCLKQ